MFYAGVVSGERQSVGVGLLIAPWLSANVVEFTPVDERAASLCLYVGEMGLDSGLAYLPNSISEY